MLQLQPNRLCVGRASSRKSPNSHLKRPLILIYKIDYFELSSQMALLQKKIQLLYFIFKHLIREHSMYEMTGLKSHGQLFYFQEWSPYVNPMLLTFLEHMKNIMLSLQGIFSTKLGKIQMRLWKTKRLNATLPSFRAPYMFNVQAFRRVREDDTHRENHIKRCAHTNIFYTETVA